MPYIGNTPADKFLTLAKQSFSTSATTSYTLDSAVSSTQDIALFINNVRQSPVDAYTVSGTALTLTSATAGTDEMYCVYLGKTVGTVSLASDSVTTAMLQANAVTTVKVTDGNITGAKLNADVVSSQTELAAIPSDSDELLISDSGVLKRLDYSYLSSGHVKAWAHFNAASSPTLSDSYGVSSIAADGTGTTLVNLTTTLGNANYSVSTGGNLIVSTAAQQFYIVSCHPASTTSQVRIDVRKVDNDGDTFAASDMDDIMILVCGDNA